IIGENGAINGEYFCQGYVVIYPGGSIPEHSHETVETYTILKGSGKMTVGSESEPITEGETVYIPRNLPHALVNTGPADMHMMFVYAPKMIVDHWAEEMSGGLKP
ncbi:MAG: cupin domain-containing protein, partial [Fusobacteriaceae bacterium]|nr:cupin domain-containing protein [Fusobacteriaceae bacterium]